MKKIINRLEEKKSFCFLILSVIILIAFYKVLNYPFNANREIGWIIQLTGRDFSFISLMKSHGFISYINYLLFGINPSGWYLTGIIIHILATYLIFIFASAVLESRKTGFVVSLLFSISTAWHDAVTIGSAYSMYPAQLFLFLGFLFFYRKFRLYKNIYFYVISLLIYFVIIPVRDSGIFFILIFFIYDVSYHLQKELFTLIKNLIVQRSKRTHFRKNIILLSGKVLQWILPWIPFVLITVFFIFLRQWYGGSPYDFNDHRARLTLKLLSEKDYFTYFRYGILGFFYYLPTHIIPYPLLNVLRDVLMTFSQNSFFTAYLVPFLGFIYYLILVLITLKSRKKNYFHHLLFGLSFLTISTLFYSFAITLTESDFSQSFGYDEHRWRYVPFFGSVFFLTVFFSHVLGKRYLGKKYVSVFLIFYLVFNTVLLWQIEDQKFNDVLIQEKLFNSTIKRIFPSYASENIIYFFPVSYQLRDYLEEWHNLWKDFYPNLLNPPENWAYEEFSKVLAKIKKSEIKLTDIYFIDFDTEKGVIDYTKKVRELIPKQHTLNVESISKNYIFQTNGILPVEFPYTATITLKVNLGQAKGKGIEAKKFDALLKYMKSHKIVHDAIQVDVCNTSGKRVMYDPNHLIDGNLGTRSVWHADCGPDWFIIDLGSVYPVSGFILGGLTDDTLNPSNYYYEISRDGRKWEKVFRVENNKKWEMMDRWPMVYNARFIRVTVLTTQRGGFVQLNEAEPVLETASDVFSIWKTRSKLMDDFYHVIENANGEQILAIQQVEDSYIMLRFFWQTNLTGVPEETTSFYFPVKLDDQYHTYTLPIYESEAFSWHGHFLKRKIEHIGIDINKFPGDINIESIQLKPLYE